MAQDLEARFKELEANVQELYDREAIRDLRYRYHEYVNEGKFAALSQSLLTIPYIEMLEREKYH